MGLAASQARYLALTARKSDLEFQSQTINTRRIQLAYRTAEIAQAYSEGMNNQRIKMATRNSQGDTVWNEISFTDLLSEGYVVIPMSGDKWDTTTTGMCPYKSGAASSEHKYSLSPTKSISTPITLPAVGTPDSDGVVIQQEGTGADARLYVFKKDASGSLTDEKIYLDQYITPDSADPGKYTLSASKTIISDAEYNNLPKAIKDMFVDATYTDYFGALSPSSDYDAGNGRDIQSLLTSGRAQIVTKSFYNYLCQRGYNPMAGTAITPAVFAQLQQDYSADPVASQTEKHTIMDWRADETEKFSQRNFTEDDSKVLAKYEAETAEIQAQDKILESQEKNIETQHKAIETELESIQKVIQNNIEKTFKIFS